MKKLILWLGCSFGVMFANAQNCTEFGYGLGFTGYLGDLQSPDFTYQTPGFANGFMIRQNFNPYFSARGFVNIARIRGDDETSFQQTHIDRNLSFRSDIYEIGLVGEYNILPFDGYNPHRNTNRRHFNFTPYVFAGINLFRFNPKTYYNGRWVALQPLNTEGQNSTLSNESAYSLVQFALPFGLGVKFQVNDKIALNYEFGFRKTFTDYLDDVSGRYVDLNDLAAEKGSLSAQLSYRGDERLSPTAEYPVAGAVRGNPDNKDWYMINMITMSYKLYGR